MIKNCLQITNKFRRIGRKRSGHYSNCKNCGKEIYDKPSVTREFCSHKCLREKRPVWNKGKKDIYFKEIKFKMGSSFRGKHHSEETKKKMSETQKRIGNKPLITPETKLKMSLAKKGKVSPKKGKPTGKPAWNKGLKGFHHTKETKNKIGNKVRELQNKRVKEGKHNWWQGGKSFEEYTTSWTKTLKLSIRERDNFTCQVCGKLQQNITFPVHHIDYNKKNCDPENLITLCSSCHSATNSHRRHWKNYFKSLKNKRIKLESINI